MPPLLVQPDLNIWRESRIHKEQARGEIGVNDLMPYEMANRRDDRWRRERKRVSQFCKQDAHSFPLIPVQSLA